MMAESIDEEAVPLPCPLPDSDKVTKSAQVNVSGMRGYLTVIDLVGRELCVLVSIYVPDPEIN